MTRKRPAYRPKPYEPKGKVLQLLYAMEEEPGRVWSLPEAARVMETGANGVMALVAYALKAGAMYRGKVMNAVALSPKPFKEGGMDPKPAFRAIAPLPPVGCWKQALDDPRIPRVVEGWTPPKMVPPRASA